MRRVLIPLTMLAVLAAFGVARSQDSAVESGKSAPAETKKKPAQQGAVAGTDPTDPRDPADLSDEFAADNEAIGSVLLADDPQNDPAAAGKRMVMQGLGLQVGALAADIRSTDDPKAREQMMAELRDTVEIAVELRKKYRLDRIARLEKLIVTLRKEAEADSVDAIVKQLLSGKSTRSGTDPPDDQDDPAADAAGGTDAAATPADDPAGNDDPANPKSKKAKSDGAAKKDKKQ